jgi:hypothetical protein
LLAFGRPSKMCDGWVSSLSAPANRQLAHPFVQATIDATQPTRAWTRNRKRRRRSTDRQARG